MPRLYFAYGSNLSKEQMRDRCPGARPVQAFVLNGYELTLRGVANIEEFEGSQVVGALYDLTQDDEAELDKYESFPTLYKKVEFETETDLGRQTVMFYQLVKPEYRRCRDGYIPTIRRGFADWGLPIETLEAAIEASEERGDPLAL